MVKLPTSKKVDRPVKAGVEKTSTSLQTGVTQAICTQTRGWMRQGGGGLGCNHLPNQFSTCYIIQQFYHRNEQIRLKKCSLLPPFFGFPHLYVHSTYITFISRFTVLVHSWKRTIFVQAKFSHKENVAMVVFSRKISK